MIWMEESEGRAAISMGLFSSDVGAGFTRTWRGGEGRGRRGGEGGRGHSMGLGNLEPFLMEREERTLPSSLEYTYELLQSSCEIYRRTGFNCVVKSLRFCVLNAYCVFNNCVIAYMRKRTAQRILRSNFGEC